MRILMTADSVGGIWTYALDLSAALLRKGWEVVLAVMGAPLTPDQQAAARRLPGLELRASAFKLEWMEDPWLDVGRAGDWLLDVASDTRPDVVHLNGYVHAALPWGAPTLVVGHSCVLSWWKAVKGCEAPAQWNRYRLETARGLACAGLVVAPTHAMLAALREAHGISGGRVIPNGRDPRRFRAERKRPFILAAGRMWDEAKNLACLRAAASKVPWTLRIAGDTGEGDPPVLPGKPEYLGRLPEAALAKEMSEAAVFAHPARYEPFGLAPLEAGLSGCALALGDIASLREVWGGAALYADPRDPEALREVLLRLIGDSLLREAMGAAARVRALHFGMEAMVSGYAQAYASLKLRPKQQQQQQQQQQQPPQRPAPFAKARGGEAREEPWNAS
jgi:glycogen(starch) synthase